MTPAHNISKYPLLVRRERVLAPIKCQLCSKEIVKGQPYYSRIGHEVHELCYVEWKK